MSAELERIYKNIDANQRKHVARLQECVRQKSISHTGEGIKETAELFVRYYKELGCQKARVVEVGKTKWGLEGDPIAYGKYDAGADKTLIIYMMYDTMPVVHGELELWKVPPWEGAIVEEPPFPKVIMARGASNSKGPEMAFLNACESIKAVAGELPVNLIFVAEGDEERMSIGLHKFVNDYKDELKEADAVYGFGYQTKSGALSQMSGSEGCVYFELETSGEYWGRGPTKYSVHGINKRWLDSPAWRHIKMLSTLVSEDGNKVLVKGWYDNIEPPTKADLKIIDEMAKKGAQYFGTVEEAKESLGAKVFINDVTDPKELFKMLSFESTLNLDGIWGGRILDTGAGAVLPYKVTSKHNCRYMPNQNGDDLVKKVRKHLDEHGYKDVKLRVVGDCDWCRANLNHDLAKAVFKMCEKFGVEIASPMPPVSVGGWPPMGPYWPAYLFGKDPLKLPIAGGTLGHGDRAHAINEYYVIEGAGKVYGLAGAEKGVATILYNYAKKT